MNSEHAPQNQHQASERQESHQLSSDTDRHQMPASFGHSPNHHKQYAHKFWPPRWPQLTKKQWIITIAALILIIAGAVAAYFIWFKPVPKPVPHKPASKPAAVKPVPKPIYSTLTGMPISDASINDRPVTAVMIENSTDARPQSGLDQAGVVFEAIAEGGITRFLTLFQDTSPQYIGPVRSVRPYYVQWLSAFDAPVAHVGGSGEALQDLKTWGIKDLDQFYNSSYYHRISSRYAPHNVYTSMDELNKLEAAKGFGKSNYTGFLRKPRETPSAAPSTTSIDFAISGYYYNVHYDYNAATNTYKRSEGGQPHMEIDASGAQTQIAPKVVIAMVLPQGIEADDLHTSYNTIGDGTAYVFQDGVAIPGTWHKTDRTSQITFTDSNGQPLPLDPGQTWITALGSTKYVSYK